MAADSFYSNSSPYRLLPSYRAFEPCWEIVSGRPPLRLKWAAHRIKTALVMGHTNKKNNHKLTHIHLVARRLVIREDLTS